MNRKLKVLAWPIAVAALTLVAGKYYFFLFLEHHEGKGPVGIPMLSAWSRPETNEVLLIGMGDSVTAGFGASPGRSYWSLLVDNAGESEPDVSNKCLKTIFPNLLTTNLAQSGSTSLQHEKNQLPRIPTISAKRVIVIITTGGNDLIHSYGQFPPKEGAMYGALWSEAQPWVQSFSNRLEKMVGELSARIPTGLDVFIATIYDPSDGTSVLRHTGLPNWKDGVRILESYNQQIRQLGKRHLNVHVVEVHDAFLGHGLHAHHWWEHHYDRSDPHCWLAANIEDPNDRGYDAIRRLMWNAMISTLEKPQK